MTHEEAATRLESSLPRMREIIETAKDLHMTWDEVSKDIEVTELAASALRSVAAASADANKRLQEWGWSVYGARWYSMGIEKVHELRTAYLAGHAARQGEVETLRAELETERMRLCACGVAALGYTHPEDEVHSDYKSASLDDVEALRKRYNTALADLKMMCGEVERLQPARSYYIREGFKNPKTGESWESFEARIDEAIMKDRPAHITEILAQRKEQ